jgi:ribosome-associated translation inhibitor RaiA
MTPRRALDNVVVQARGRVRASEHTYALDKVAALAHLAPGPVLAARVEVTVHSDPAREHPAVAKAELNVNGQFLRARAAAETVPAAVDALQARLRHRLERLGDRERAKHLRHRDGDGGWRHGDAVEPQLPYYPRPVEERQIVRRKTFALDPVTPEDAAADLELLDHDFYLFRNAETGRDNVIWRVGEERYELLQPSGDRHRDGNGRIRASRLHPGVMRVEDAVELLDLGDVPFVFFLDAVSERAAVVYRRYDGHYGLVVATDDQTGNPTGG